MYSTLCSASLFLAASSFLRISHLLAGLVCLSECRAMLRISFDYAQMALLMAIHDEDHSVEILSSQRTGLNRLVSFCKSISRQERLCFICIIDQLNADGSQPYYLDLKQQRLSDFTPS
jgi:hypothetical protein